jgi:hypothetical protein
MVNELKVLLNDMKRFISCINICMSIISLIILIVIEVYQNKFKKEYQNFLSMLNVNFKQ